MCWQFPLFAIEQYPKFLQEAIVLCENHFRQLPRLIVCSQKVPRTKQIQIPKQIRTLKQEHYEITKQILQREHKNKPQHEKTRKGSNTYNNKERTEHTNGRRNEKITITQTCNTITKQTQKNTQTKHTHRKKHKTNYRRNRAKTAHKTNRYEEQQPMEICTTKYQSIRTNKYLMETC